MKTVHVAAPDQTNSATFLQHYHVVKQLYYIQRLRLSQRIAIAKPFISWKHYIKQCQISTDQLLSYLKKLIITKQKIVKTKFTNNFKIQGEVNLNNLPTQA